MALRFCNQFIQLAAQRIKTFLSLLIIDFATTKNKKALHGMTKIPITNSINKSHCL